MGGETGWGLKEYFRQHGKAESLFIAGGMMTLFYIIYFVILGLPLNWFYLAIYGVVLDWIFRAAMLFPSLKGYYNHLNYFWSGFWGGTPMLMPYGIMLMIDKLSMK
jgi:cobalamin biosynthesis protein CobD/CbiB